MYNNPVFFYILVDLYRVFSVFIKDDCIFIHLTLYIIHHIIYLSIHSNLEEEQEK